MSQGGMYGRSPPGGKEGEKFHLLVRTDIGQAPSRLLLRRPLGFGTEAWCGEMKWKSTRCGKCSIGQPFILRLSAFEVKGTGELLLCTRKWYFSSSDNSMGYHKSSLSHSLTHPTTYPSPHLSLPFSTSSSAHSTALCTSSTTTCGRQLGSPPLYTPVRTRMLVQSLPCGDL